MKTLKQYIIFTLLTIILIGVIMAADWTPTGDINLRGTYAIKNATNITSGNIVSSGNITADYFFGDASQLTGIIATNATSSEYWDDLNSVNTTQMDDTTSTLSIKESWFTTIWNSLFGAKTGDDFVSTFSSKQNMQNKTFFNISSLILGNFNTTIGVNKFQIVQDGGGTPTVSSASSLFEVDALDGSHSDFNFRLSDSSTGYPVIIFSKSKGTLEIPLNESTARAIGGIEFKYYQQGTWGTSAEIRAVINGTINEGDTSDFPANLVFYTTPENSSTQTARMTIYPDGSIYISNNVTASWFLGKINHSNIQNLPAYSLAGNCTSGQVVMNVTTSGVQCVAPSLAETDPQAYNGTLAYNSSLANYYLNSNPFNFINSTANASYYLASNPFGFWNNTNNQFNKTYADTLYASISVTGDNSSWNQSLANTLYYGISNPYSFWNATTALFNKTYADTLYLTIGTKLGNTTNEIWVVVDNNTFLKVESDPNWAGNYTAFNATWSSITNSSYAVINQSNNGNINFTGNLSFGDRICSTSGTCYTLIQLNTTITDTDAFNTTAQIWTVVDNSTFLRISAFHVTNSSYYLVTNPFGFYNSSTIPVYATWAQVVNGTVYLSSNPLGFYNSSTIPTYATWAQVVNGTVYLSSNPLGFLNLTNAFNTTQSIANFVNRSLWTTIDNYPAYCTSGQYISGINDTLICSIVPTYNSTYDTYQTNLSNVDCSAGNLVIGIQTNGTVLCATDSATNVSYYLANNPYAFWNSTINLFNKTYTDTLYSTIGEPLAYNGTLAYNSSLANYALLGGSNTFGAFNQTFDTPTLFIDSANNRIGIGTITPTNDTVISRSATGNNPTLRLENTGAFAASEPTIDFANSAGTFVHARISSFPGTSYINSVLRFLVANSAKVLTERMRIDVNGNVGINTTSPTNTLNVIGDINATNNIIAQKLNISSHFSITVINITCFNAGCTWYTNASNSCTYWPSGGKDCGSA